MMPINQGGQRSPQRKPHKTSPEVEAPVLSKLHTATHCMSLLFPGQFLEQLCLPRVCLFMIKVSINYSWSDVLLWIFHSVQFTFSPSNCWC